MSSASVSNPNTMAREDLARLNAALQAELVVIKAETTAKVASLEDTITNLAHENALLKRRLFGNKTERSNTSEAQLALGDLLAAEAELQKELNAALERAKDAIDPEPEPSRCAGTSAPTWVRRSPSAKCACASRIPLRGPICQSSASLWCASSRFVRSWSSLNA